MRMPQVRPDPAIAEALTLLGKAQMLLVVHGASFPAADGADAGRGTPYGRAGEEFARFLRGLGFTGLQLGPQGQTSPVNASPYDGALFSRNILALDMEALVDEGLVDRRSWAAAVADNPLPDGRWVAYTYALGAYGRMVDEAYASFARGRDAGDPAALALDREIRQLRPRQRWLRDDGLYEALCIEHRHVPWRRWPADGEAGLDRVLCAPPPELRGACAARRVALETRYAERLERHALAQTLLLRQHHGFLARMHALGLKVYGDAQVGFSMRDTWSRQGLLLPGYFLGAPPSRTNREGQPWGYQVLDPARLLDADGRPGEVLRFLSERWDKLLGEFDGLRLDHPHGLVCPWVYRADDPDPYHAVQNGARLFASPDLPDHPGLAAYAIARPEQIDRSRPRYADDWERDLDAEQEDRYALVMDALMAQARAHGRDSADILCEVLSTEPLPLARVRRRHGLGRFRVTQKADLERPDDVYRSENASPEDWVMVGNHDTPSLWQLARAWHGSAEADRQARYLAERLRLAEPARLADDIGLLAHAKMADIFLSPARNVMMFFADLLGMEERYNVPGTVSDDNWTLRVPPDYASAYAAASRAGRALNLYAVLAAALRARPEIGRPDLVARLDERAGWTLN